MIQQKFTGNIILADGEKWKYLLPLTFTRPVGDIRIGIHTFVEKWQAFTNGVVSSLTQNYLQKKYPTVWGKENLIIQAGILPTQELYSSILDLKEGSSLFAKDQWIATRTHEPFESFEEFQHFIAGKEKVQISENISIKSIFRPWHIIAHLSEEIVKDISILTNGRASAPLSSSNRIIGPDLVFMEEGAKAECVIFNTTTGPIYIGKNAEIMEGSMIRGPFVLGEGSTVNMGAKIYGPTAIGPKCKVGGEVKGTQFFGNANKGHDGFLGDSVIGEWCNLGADTNASNLKNNYLPVRAWSYVEEKFVDTGLQFCGLIMGDHSKTGINTMLNTGTVTGAYANIFGEGYPRTFIPSFSWGGASGFASHPIKKAMETAEIVMSRRQMILTKEDIAIAEYILQHDTSFRSWEKTS